jgi:hypothetical protein
METLTRAPKLGSVALSWEGTMFHFFRAAAVAQALYAC